MAEAKITAKGQNPMHLVNKVNNLAPDFIPDGLVEPNVRGVKAGMQVSEIVKEPLGKMFQAAEKEGLVLFLASAYRSYGYQEDLFHKKVCTVGAEAANQYVAKPGQSEHQTGLAVDITCESEQYDLNETFATTKEGKWLSKNAHHFGFILRYPADKVLLTGYNNEPWHFRYIGDNEIAAFIYEKQLCLEEYIENTRPSN
ncbi:MAG: zinc D-Ala-D-Ala carboxypeptidase [Clostridiales bacterium]|jgi:D-alanyl-D-alanine carboxypeptidase|nr:zinc D-Ala-D-Ala carboxypeptidase [Clostridiales bacterium]MDN5300032.1 zinc D-Ala-D-Ala carboxypeptidase [Clostridiales bacterium]